MDGRQERRRADAPAATPLELLSAVAVVGVLALLLGLVALARPLTEQDTRTAAYVQRGSFSYTADAPADSVYGEQGVQSGQPVLLDVAGPVTLAFDYRLETRAPATLRGTASLTATLTLPEGIERELEVAPATDFTGGEVSISGELPLDAARALVARSGDLDPEQSSAEAVATLTVRPTIDVEGRLAGSPLTAALAPDLTFTLSAGRLALDQSTSDETETDADAALTSSTRGEVERTVDVDATLPLLVVQPRVLTVRVLALGLALACLLLGLWLARPLLRRAGPGAEAGRIQTLYGSRIVDVDDLSLGDEPVADVASIDALADLAKRHQSAMMRLRVDDEDHYLLWDQGLVYRYRFRDTTTDTTTDTATDTTMDATT